MRLMSNNLEKENSLLFAMGFSFLLIITPSEFNKANELKDGDEIKEFDFQSINSVFNSVSSKRHSNHSSPT